MSDFQLLLTTEGWCPPQGRHGLNQRGSAPWVRVTPSLVSESLRTFLGIQHRNQIAVVSYCCFSYCKV